MTTPARDPRDRNRHSTAAAFSNAAQVEEWLTNKGPAAAHAAARVVRTWTLLLETRVKAAASGRPGPRVRTGDYRRRINGLVFRRGDAIVGQVGTDHPAARRLEYGFVGADRLGRVYDQPPFPHFGPAAKRTLPEFAAALAKEAVR